MDYHNRNIEYTILQREVDTNRTLYEGLLQRYKEIGVAGGVDSGALASNLSMVDRARIPGAPYKPNLPRNQPERPTALRACRHRPGILHRKATIPDVLETSFRRIEIGLLQQDSHGVSGA
jgi:hypothetical protein